MYSLCHVESGLTLMASHVVVLSHGECDSDNTKHSLFGQSYASLNSKLIVILNSKLTSYFFYG